MDKKHCAGCRGTRGAYGFRVDGADKVTYNHFDSYPEALGRTIVEYVKAYADRTLKMVARRLVPIVEGSKATPKQVERYKKWADLGVDDNDPSNWYVLLRHTQGQPRAWHDGVEHYRDSNTFLADSLFCEYAYIVNVDDGKLEFYKGFNKDRSAPGRYASLVREKQYPDDRQEYSGVTLVEAVPFGKIREQQTATTVKRWDRLTRSDDE